MIRQAPVILFKNEHYGTLRLDVAPVELPELIRESIQQLETVRFFCPDYTVEIGAQEQIFFFEWQRIEIAFEPHPKVSGQAPFRLLVNKLPVLTSRRVDQQHLLSGILRMENAVGFTDIRIIDRNGQSIFNLETEIFPQKIDYKQDFQLMVQEITNTVYALLFDYLRKTFGQAELSAAFPSTKLGWLAVFEQQFEQLCKGIDRLLQQPAFQIDRSLQLREPARVKRVAKNLPLWLNKNPKYQSTAPEAYRVNDSVGFLRLPEEHKTITTDTYENRLIAWSLQRACNQLQTMEQLLQRLFRPEAAKTGALEQIRQYRQRLQFYQQTSLFHPVKKFNYRQSASNILSKSPGYRELYRLFRNLHLGLSIFEHSLFRLDYKDTAQLYEYWCFLKVVRLFRDHPDFEQVEGSLIRTQSDQLVLDLQKGKASRLVFCKRDQSERYELYFNRAFRTDTFEQRPDISICFFKNGHPDPFWYIFDAKYRFNPNAQIDYEAPADAISQLHRYRDAIIHRNETDATTQNSIKNLGGIILYPYPGTEDEFTQNRFYKSIATVNIGALPFLPGKYKLLQDFLDQLFVRSPDSLLESIVEYDKSNYQAMLRQLEEPWLLLSWEELTRDEQTEIMFKQQVLQLPLPDQPEPEWFSAKGIAIWSEKHRQLKCLARVVQIDSQSQAPLPTSSSRSQSRLFYRLEDIQNLEIPLKTTALRTLKQVNRLALEILIQTDRTTALYLDSFNAVRIWRELEHRNITFELVREENKNLNFMLSERGIKLQPAAESGYGHLDEKYDTLENLFRSL